VIVVTVTVELLYGGVVVLLDVHDESVQGGVVDDVVEELVVEEQDASVQGCVHSTPVQGALVELELELTEHEASVQDEEDELELDVLDVEEIDVGHGGWTTAHVVWQP